MTDITLPEGFGTLGEALQRVHAAAKEAVAELNKMQPTRDFWCVFPLEVVQTRFCIDQDGDVEIEVIIEEAAPDAVDLRQAVWGYIAARHPELAAYVFVQTEW